jgi:dienelactone hydrolase
MWWREGESAGRIVSALVVLAAVMAAPLVQAETQVKFDGTTPEGGRIKLTGLLDVPEGPGPFPAVVLLHDQWGFSWDLTVANYRAWAERLVEWGYAALRVDSLGARNVSSVGDNVKEVSPEASALDAYAARAYLARQAMVDGKRVGVLGWSHGAVAGMSVADAQNRRKGMQPFQAVVSYYPWSLPALKKQDTPILILYGDSDVNCPPSMFNQFTQNWSKGDRKFELTVKKYRMATHWFDVQGFSFVSAGDRFEYNRAAARDSIEEIRLFLKKYLRP